MTTTATVRVERHVAGGHLGFKAFADGHLVTSELFKTTKLAREFCQKLGYTLFRYPDGKFENE